MKLIIKSSQDYGSHVDNYEEIFDCTIEIEEDVLKINFENGFIKLEENKITYERKENKIIIEPDKTIGCDYETPYGMFVLDIKGLEVKKEIVDYKKLKENSFSGTVAMAKYEIQMVGVEAYINSIEISLDNT